ncbi:MAG: hypothetical protein AB7I48_19575 [Planctomycetaceae bacterium]
MDIDITVPAGGVFPVVPARLSSSQAVVEFFAYEHVGADKPVLIRVTDVPTAFDIGKHGSPETALLLDFPCEVSGQLIAGDEQDWYAFEAKRGEVICFDLPAALDPGPYTFALQAVTEVLLADGNTISVPAISNPMTLNVSPAPFLLSIDPHTPRQIARGQIVQLNYTADRKNGFIGKIHTELRATGGLSGLRARGVTFVGGTSSGVIQIMASDDAPLGPVEFLHLDAVGTVEDEPVYHSRCFVDLEIVP